MALHDLATLADALTFALLTAVSGAIAWGVFRVAARRYGFRRTTSTVSAAAVLTLALGTMALWPAARGGTEGNTGVAIPDGSAPEAQRTTTPALPAPEPVAPPSTEERFVDANSARVGRDGSQNEGPNPQPTEDAPGGSGSGPGDPGTTPDPPPSQTPPPDPPPSPDEGDDDEGDDDEGDDDEGDDDEGDDDEGDDGGDDGGDDEGEGEGWATS
ncbi:MAG TPA: hypothetical protein VFI59_06775 [Actinomycetota bacterium]|nr:hypothetical protein [Actinomycetota bacterium]